MDSITLSFDTYVNADGTTVTGDTQAYSVLGVRGLDNPDELQLWPAISKTLLDGSLAQTNLKARRVITVDFGVLQTKDLRNLSSPGTLKEWGRLLRLFWKLLTVCRTNGLRVF
jgi:hypothetical protein